MRRLLHAAVVLAAVALKAFAANPILINDVDWVPFFMQGERKGFAHEVVQAFLDERRMAHAFVLLPPPRTELYMKSGQIDLCVYSRKPERDAFAWFGKEALFSIDYRIAVRSDAALSVKRLDDLEPLRVGRIRGIAYTPEITAFLDRPQVADRSAITKDLTSQLQMLAAGRIDAVIEAASAIGWEGAELGLTERIRFVGPVLSTKPYFLAISKASATIPDGLRFLAAFDAWFRGFKGRPEYTALTRKYGLQP